MVIVPGRHAQLLIVKSRQVLVKQFWSCCLNGIPWPGWFRWPGLVGLRLVLEVQLAFASAAELSDDVRGDGMQFLVSVA